MRYIDLAEVKDVPDIIDAVNANRTKLTDRPVSQQTQRGITVQHARPCPFRLADSVLRALPFGNAAVAEIPQRNVFLQPGEPFILYAGLTNDAIKYQTGPNIHAC